MDLYVYYRAAAADAGPLLEKASAMQAALAARCGVAVALKRRPIEQDGRHTWMEVYLAVPDDFGKALEQAVEQAGLMRLTDGERHIESFLDMCPCA